MTSWLQIRQLYTHCLIMQSSLQYWKDPLIQEAIVEFAMDGNSVKSKAARATEVMVKKTADKRRFNVKTMPPVFRTCWKYQQTPSISIICPRAGWAFTLYIRGISVFIALMIRFAPLQLQRVNRALGSAAWRIQESRRCACSPKNYHSAALEAMNSVRE